MSMKATEITQGVKVSVSTAYQEGYSNPLQSHYVFTYKIRIENNSEYTVQLLSRHWFIVDTHCEVREIEGQGVVGLQPVLEPGESHEYASGCNLQTEIGKMLGTYTMERIIDGKKFDVIIPEFVLIAPYKLN